MKKTVAIPAAALLLVAASIGALLLAGRVRVETRRQDVTEDFLWTWQLLIQDKGGNDRLHEWLKARLYYLSQVVPTAVLKRANPPKYGPVDEVLLGDMPPGPPGEPHANDYYQATVSRMNQLTK